MTARISLREGLVVGGLFLLHGIDKLGDMSGTERFFASFDIPAPGLMAPFVAVTETVGGVLLIVGLATPLIGLALVGDMLVASLTATSTRVSSWMTAASNSSCCSAARASPSPSRVPGGFSVDAALGVTRRLWLRVSERKRPANAGLSRSG